MKLLCTLGWHRPIPSRLWNDGHFFSACQRCGVQMVRAPGEPFHPVPRTMKVVWRPRTDDDIVWPMHTG